MLTILLTLFQKTPFAGSDANSDLGRFYHDCQVAPTLRMFEDSSNVEETINAITDQLATFEANAKDFDEFVNSFQMDDEEGDEEWDVMKLVLVLTHWGLEKMSAHSKKKI